MTRMATYHHVVSKDICFNQQFLISNHHKGVQFQKRNLEIMEMSTHSLSYAKASSLSPSFFPGKSTFVAHRSVNFLGYNCLPRKLKFSARQLRSFGAVRADSSSATDGSVRWVLEPIGNGDFRHIGYKIAMPGAFEIVSNAVTVGRVPDKADIVIPVPTVSGLHARIQKTEDNLLITDLDSTNGTFINEQRLQPGVVSAASSGNLITFGDTNLAIFRVYKLEKEESEEPSTVPEEEEEEEQSISSEATS